jgi:hypothetical protein
VLGGPAGREREWATACDALSHLCDDGRGRVVLVSGEPGIGKTHFAEALAAAAAERGLLVVWGRAWEVEGAPPFWPFFEALRALSRLVPELPTPSEMTAWLDGTSAPPDEGIRFRLFDRIVEHLRAVGAHRPLLLVLDDLHAADKPSLLLLQLLARSLHGLRLLIIATHREVAPTLDRATLTRIAREAVSIPLGPLAGDALDRVVRGQTDVQSGLDEIVTKSGGNPLFALELARSPNRASLPRSIEETVRQHLAVLSAEAQQVAAAASVLGRELDRGELGRLTPLLDEHWSELVAAGILHETVERRAIFSHVLLRDVIYRQLSAAERRALHARVTVELAHLPRAAFARRSAEAVHHALAAGEHARALDWAVIAIEYAAQQLAFEESVRLADSVLAAIPPAAESAAARARIGVARASVLMRAGDSEAGRVSAFEAAELAAMAGHPVLYGEAALAYATAFRFGGVEPRMLELLTAAIERLPEGNDALRARLVARLSSGVYPAQPDRSAALADEALALSIQLGDDRVRLDVLTFVQASAIRVRDGLETNRVRDEEALELALKLDDPFATMQTRVRLYNCALQAADLARADLHLANYLLDVGRHAYGMHHRISPAIRAGRAALAGDLDTATRLLDEYAERNADEKSPELRVGFDGVRFNLLRLRRRPIGADEYTQTPEIHRFAPHFVSQERAWGAAMSGDANGVRQLLRNFPPMAGPWMAFIAEVAYIVGDRELALRVRPFVDKIEAPVLTWGPIFIESSVAAARARIAAVLGEPEAVAHYEEALAVYERLQAPIWRARIELELARVIARGDRSRALALLASSEATAKRLGHEGLAGEVERARSALAPSTSELTLERAGEVWTLKRGDESVTLRDSKGVHYLAELLRRPGSEVHVSELVAADGDEPIDVGSAGEELDATAQKQYRDRIEALRERLADAEERGAADAAERARCELEALAGELKRAVGLGGRTRQAGSRVERARVNVQRRLKDVLERVQKASPSLARELEASLITGTYCLFRG